jgi:nitrogen fixation/metabolism regulation signal transduction histidine kinase
MKKYKLLTIISGIILLLAVFPFPVPLYYFQILSIVVIATAVIGVMKARKQGKGGWKLILTTVAALNLVQFAPWLLPDILVWIVFNLASAGILLASGNALD